MKNTTKEERHEYKKDNPHNPDKKDNPDYEAVRLTRKIQNTKKTHINCKITTKSSKVRRRKTIFTPNVRLPV